MNQLTSQYETVNNRKIQEASNEQTMLKPKPKTLTIYHNHSSHACVHNGDTSTTSPEEITTPSPLHSVQRTPNISMPYNPSKSYGWAPRWPQFLIPAPQESERNHPWQQKLMDPWRNYEYPIHRRLRGPSCCSGSRQTFLGWRNSEKQQRSGLTQQEIWDRGGNEGLEYHVSWYNHWEEKDRGSRVPNPTS